MQIYVMASIEEYIGPKTIIIDRG